MTPAPETAEEKAERLEREARTPGRSLIESGDFPAGTLVWLWPETFGSRPSRLDVSAAIDSQAAMEVLPLPGEAETNAGIVRFRGLDAGVTYWLAGEHLGKWIAVARQAQSPTKYVRGHESPSMRPVAG